MSSLHKTETYSVGKAVEQFSQLIQNAIPNTLFNEVKYFIRY